MQRLEMESRNIVLNNIEEIGKLFPNCITEENGEKKIDFELLKQELSASLVNDIKEKYQLVWPGKKESIVEANTPTNKTLRPNY